MGALAAFFGGLCYFFRVRVTVVVLQRISGQVKVVVEIRPKLWSNLALVLS